MTLLESIYYVFRRAQADGVVAIPDDDVIQRVLEAFPDVYTEAEIRDCINKLRDDGHLPSIPQTKDENDEWQTLN